MRRTPPGANGKIECWHQTLQGDCICVKLPLSLEDARRIVAGLLAHSNKVRLHSGIGNVTPKDKLTGHSRNGGHKLRGYRHLQMHELCRLREKVRRNGTGPFFPPIVAKLRGNEVPRSWREGRRRAETAQCGRPKPHTGRKWCAANGVTAE